MEGGNGKTGAGDSPYEFDPGKSFFGNEGHQGTIEGTFREVAGGDTIETVTPGDAIGGQSDPGAGGGSPEFVIPGTGPGSGGPGQGGTGKRKYTRRNQKEVQSGLVGFEDAIFAIHLALAGIARCPELELDQDEAKKVTVALDKLATHYHVEPSETAKIWMNFAGAMTSVYAPRAIAIYKRVQREQDARREKVVPIRS